LSLIGIDIGTSFIKGAILDLKTCRYTHVRRVAFPDPLPSHDTFHCEFDPQPILAEVASILKQLANIDSSCDGIVLCTQMASMVLVNETGDTLTNCIGWRDQRATMKHPSGKGSYHEVIRAHITPQQRAELGNELPVGAPACFLFWLRENGQLNSGTIPVTLADFVISNLCRSHPTVDATNALAYGLFDLKARAWHMNVIQQLGLHHIRWPAIVSDGHIVGHMRLGDRYVPCYAPAGDYQCALVGAMVNTNELSLNISTGSQVSRITDHLQKGEYQSRPYFENKFVNTLSHLPAGRSLNILVDLLTEIARKAEGSQPDPWPYIAEVASAAQDSDLDIKTSFFPGPCGNTGHIANIGERNLTVGTLFRAVFRNMAENYYACALKIWPDCSWENLVISGGLGRKLLLLRQMIQSRFQSEIRLCQVEEDTLLGLMILGMVFSGEAESLESATLKVQRIGNLDIE
jgi:sugar (pentulose or hexulose) kinase